MSGPLGAQVSRFDLPAQDAVTGIPAFARQAGVQILVSEAAVRGRDTSGVHGDLSVEDALAELLEGTGLEITSNDGKTITLAIRHISRAASAPASVEDPADPALSEVVITANHRDERLQDVPSTVNAVRGATIRAKNAQDFRDYLTTVPGVNFSEGNLGQMRVSIRGVSDGIGSFDPLTGIYIDEAPVTEGYGPTLDPDVYDVERVEVLKGPQGTLYGAGSMGGTVRIITKKPVINAFEASGDAMGSDTNGGGVNGRVDAAVNLPLVNDRIAVRFSGGYRKDAGWIDDVYRNVQDANDIEKKNFHGQVLWHPEANTSVILRLMYQKSIAGQPNWEDIGQSEYRTSRAYSMYTDTEARLYSLTVQHDADWMSVTSASNYLIKNTGSGVDFTNVARPLILALSQVTLAPTEGVGLVNQEQLNLFTQEMRLASRGKTVLEWTLGGFYSNATTHFNQSLDFRQAPSIDAVTSGPAYLQSLNTFSTRQLAGFGELTYNITERIAVTAGIRQFEVSQPTTAVDSGILNGGNSRSQREQDSHSHTSKLALKYRLSSENLVYALAAQGYRNGVAGTPIPPVCAVQAAALGYSTIPNGVNPDKLWNYELGTKNAMLNGRLAANAAAFFIDWSNIQNQVALACGANFGINGGDAVSKGGELELWARPVESWTLNAAASYVDAHLTAVAPGVRATKDDPLPLVSRWSWNTSGQYDIKVTGALTGFLRAEVNHVGSRWNTYRTLTPTAYLMPSYTTLTLRVGIEGRNWSAAAFGTNLTDQHVIQYSPNTTYRQVAAPRTIGLNVRLDY